MWPPQFFILRTFLNNRLLFPHIFLNFSTCDFIFFVLHFYVSFGPKYRPLPYFYFGCSLLLPLPKSWEETSWKLTIGKKLFHYLRSHPSCCQCCVGLYLNWSAFQSFAEKFNIYVCNFHIPWWLLLIKTSVHFTKQNFMSTISHQDFL